MPRKRQSTKSRIRQSRMESILQKRIRCTTVDDIIAASKTSKGTFYHYFKGKDALFKFFV